MKQIEKQGEDNEETHNKRVNSHSRNSFTNKEPRKDEDDEEEEEVNFNDEGENVTSSLEPKRLDAYSINVNEFPKDKKEAENQEDARFLKQDSKVKFADLLLTFLDRNEV